MREFFFAFFISVFNLLSGILVYEKIINKPNKLFFRVFFSSVLLRYVINLFFLWVCFKLLNFDTLKFALSYMIGTFLAIILEVFCLNKKTKLLNLQFKQNKNFEEHKDGKQ